LEERVKMNAEKLNQLKFELDSAVLTAKIRMENAVGTDNTAEKAGWSGEYRRLKGWADLLENALKE
jgi:hypothetical protein